MPRKKYKQLPHDISYLSVSNEPVFFRKKGFIYGLLFILVTLFASFIVYFEEPLNDSSIKEYLGMTVEPTYPTFLYSYSAIGIDSKWLLFQFQPYVQEFYTNDKGNFILAYYFDQDGNKQEVNIFVTGKSIKTVSFPDGGADSRLSFESLQRTIKKDMQIRILYLADFPDPQTRSPKFCNDQPTLCVLAEVANSSKSELRNFYSQGQSSTTLIVPAFSIYTSLLN